MIDFIQIYKIASKYSKNYLYLRCQKLSLISLFIVKCMNKCFCKNLAAVKLFNTLLAMQQAASSLPTSISHLFYVICSNCKNMTRVTVLLDICTFYRKF